MRGLWLGLAVGGLVACGDLSLLDLLNAEQQAAEQGQETPEAQAFTVQLKKEYGFCAEDCTRTVRVDSEGAGLARVVDRSSGAVRERTFALLPEELAALKGDVATATARPWEASYGCPDCVDQGAYTLELTQGERVRTSVVDPGQRPAHLAPLLGRLDALESAHRP